MPQDGDEFVSEEMLTNLIELQGFSSNFRIRLLEAIATSLIKLFDKSNSFFQTGDLGNAAFGREVALVRLKKFEAPIDDYRGAMYFECKSSLDVVKNSGDRNLAEMTRSVLRAEHEAT